MKKYDNRNIYLKKVKNYSAVFELEDDLCPEHERLIGIAPHYHLECDFLVSFDDDLALIELINLFIVNPENSKYIQIDLNDYSFDTEYLEEKIAETDTGDWLNDYRIDLADYRDDYEF